MQLLCSVLKQKGCVTDKPTYIFFLHIFLFIFGTMHAFVST